MLAIELTRKGLDRPLAVLLVHHENKQGDVSGAWQGRTDTLAHVQAQGNGATRLYWRKVRWGSTLHETVWKLLWRDGEGFELDDTPELTDDDVAASILTAVREHPGASMRTVAEHARGRGTRQREIRDELLESGALVNVGEGSRFVLYIAGDPALEQVRPEWDAPGTHSASATGSTAEKSERVPRPAL